MSRKLIKSLVLSSMLVGLGVNAAGGEKKEKENHFNPDQYSNLIGENPVVPVDLFGKSALSGFEKLDKELLYKENDKRLVFLLPYYAGVKTFIEDKAVFHVLANSSLREYWVTYNSTNNKFKRKRALKSFSSKFEDLKSIKPSKTSGYIYNSYDVKSWYEFNFDEMSKTFVAGGFWASGYGCFVGSGHVRGDRLSPAIAPMKTSSVVKSGKSCDFRLEFGDDETSAEAVEEAIENVSIHAQVRVLGKTHYDLLPVIGLFIPTGEMGVFNADKNKLVYKIEAESLIPLDTTLDWMVSTEAGSDIGKTVSVKSLEEFISYTGSYGTTSNTLFKFQKNGNELLYLDRGYYKNTATLSRLVFHSQSSKSIRYKLSAIASGTLDKAPAYIDIMRNLSRSGRINLTYMDQKGNASDLSSLTKYTNEIEKGYEAFLKKDADRNPAKELKIISGATLSSAELESVQKNVPDSNNDEIASSGGTPVTVATVAGTVPEKNPDLEFTCDRELQDLGSFFNGQHLISTQKMDAPLNYVFPRLKKILVDEEYVLGEHNSDIEFVFYQIVSETRRYTAIVNFKENNLSIDLKMPAGTTAPVDTFKDYFCSLYEKV
jgi:hypothetical protein